VTKVSVFGFKIPGIVSVKIVKSAQTYQKSKFHMKTSLTQDCPGDKPVMDAIQQNQSAAALDESALCDQFASAVKVGTVELTGLIGNLAYYNSINLGDTFQGQHIPHIHRAISLPKREELAEESEYVMVNKMTGMLQYYDINEISGQVSSILGISVLILREESFNGANEEARHGVLHSSHLGQPCFVAPRLEAGLCLALYEDFKLRFKKKSSKLGYHALVVPVEAMTLDEFVLKFAFRDNWQVCRFVAGRGNEEEEIWEDESPTKITLDGVDTALGKLIKLLNAFGPRLNGASRRLASIIGSTIASSLTTTWDGLTSNMMIASGINVLLHHLSSSLDPHKHVSSAILIESLQDSLNSKYEFQDEWEVVNITQRVNNAILFHR
jgi:hypothetical protein